MDSNVQTPVLLGRVDTGGSAVPGQGVEGLVRITDLNRRNASDPDFLTTEYRRLTDGSGTPVMQVVNNDTTRLVADDSGNSLRVPSNVVANITADNARGTTFQPVAKQALFLIQLREVEFGDNIAASRFTSFDDSAFVGRTPFTNATDYGVLNNGSALLDLTRPGLNGLPGKIIGDDIFTRHLLRADVPIDILFRGNDLGDVDIDAEGDLLLGDLVRNSTGRTLLVTDTGNLSALSDKVTVIGQNLVIGANDGTVLGAAGGALRTNLSADGTLTALGIDSVKIREIEGDMQIASVISLDSDTSDGGLLELLADGSILSATADTPAVIGGDIILSARSGRIGGTGDANG